MFILFLILSLIAAFAGAIYGIITLFRKCGKTIFKVFRIIAIVCAITWCVLFSLLFAAVLLVVFIIIII